MNIFIKSRLIKYFLAILVSQLLILHGCQDPETKKQETIINFLKGIKNNDRGVVQSYVNYNRFIIQNYNFGKYYRMTSPEIREIFRKKLMQLWRALFKNVILEFPQNFQLLNHKKGIKLKFLNSQNQEYILYMENIDNKYKIIGIKK